MVKARNKKSQITARTIDILKSIWSQGEYNYNQTCFPLFLVSYYQKPGLFPMAQFITEKSLRQFFTEVKPIKMGNSDT